MRSFGAVRSVRLFRRSRGGRKARRGVPSGDRYGAELRHVLRRSGRGAGVAIVPGYPAVVGWIIQRARN